LFVGRVLIRSRSERASISFVNADYVERGDRARETLERELTDTPAICAVFDLSVQALCDQDLAVGRLVGEPRRRCGTRTASSRRTF
jgi:hypothetical protein